MSLRQVKPRELLRALKKAGFVVRRQKGSHVFLEYDDGVLKRMTSLSLHNKPFPLGTLRAILKQTRISEEELKDLL